MLTRIFTHRLFAPSLLLAVFGLGALTVALLLFGPGSAPWVDSLLTACFGWNAETRHYRLDALVLTLLEPPLFAAVIWFFYADELRAFLGSSTGRLVAGTTPAVFVALAATLLATGEISASGVAPAPSGLLAPLRQGAAAPGFSLTDHRGRVVTLEGFKGRPVAVTFVYAGCHATCPLLVERLKALEARTAPGPVAFVAVTLDPVRDTPETLAAAAARWELGDRWHLLTGPPETVRAVIRAYGVQWAPLPEGEIAHENVVLLIDSRGRLAFTYRGLAHPEDRQAADLARLARERG